MHIYYLFSRENALLLNLKCKISYSNVSHRVQVFFSYPASVESVLIGNVDFLQVHIVSNWMVYQQPTSVWILSCLFKVLDCLNVLSDFEQQNCFSPVWILSWVFRLTAWLNFFTLLSHKICSLEYEKGIMPICLFFYVIRNAKNWCHILMNCHPGHGNPKV